MKKIISIWSMAVFILGAAAVHGDVSPFMLPAGSGSVSHSDSPFAALVNPVFNDQSGTPSLAYGYTAFNGETEGNHLLLLRLLGISLNYGMYKLAPGKDGALEKSDAHFFSISKGVLLNEKIGLGASYAFSRGEVDEFNGFSAWNFGFIIRPFRYLSMGLTINNTFSELNGREFTRNEIYSLSVRPFTDRITFSVDAFRDSGENIKAVDYSWSACFRALYDISFSFRYDREKTMYFGMIMPIYSSTSGASMALNGGTAYGDRLPGSYFAGFSFSGYRYETPVNLSDGDRALHIKFYGDISEVKEKRMFSDTGPGFFDIVRSIRSAALDDGIGSIIMEIEDAGMGFARLQEVRRSIQYFRSKGKKVYAVMTSSGNREYYLAAAADKIYHTPNTPFIIKGLVFNVYFFRGLLDKAGVKFESIKRGAYKSFNESYTNTGMSREFRENMHSLLEDINEQFLQDIETDRRLTRKDIEALFALYSIAPESAVKSGFVDYVRYPEEAVKGLSENQGLIRVEDYIKSKRVDFSWGGYSRIAVVHVDGTITRGVGGRRPVSGSISDGSYRDILEEVFSDNRVRAVVIRVNSGGGSAAASDYMWNNLIRLKKKHEKRVIISFGDMAASGGYYIACTGDRIYASRGTVTGSIGVVSGKISMKELYKKLGVTKETLKMSEFSDIYSETKDLSDKERKVLQSEVDFIYNAFTEKVNLYRQIKKERIPETAEGRVFSGRQSVAMKLVDDIGGILDAVEYARDVTGIGEYYNVVEYPEEMSLYFEILASAEVRAMKEYMKALLKNINYFRFDNENVLYLFPYVIDIE